ncbi:glycosyltransferase [Patescibacteria group bacterium AH-259-L05]|nr:glycosyltransferase [Patescibacteria group bacterium AH-259-L05]
MPIKKGRWLNVKYFYFDTPTLNTIPQKEESFFQKSKNVIKKFQLLQSLAQFFFVFYLPFNIILRGKKIIQKETIELMLGYSDYGPAFLSTYLLHKITKKPFFLFFYDLYYGNNFSLPYRILARFLEPKLFKNAEKIFVMSEALQAYYQKKYKREIFVIHNSIPIKDAKPETHFNPSGPYKIIFTGTIYWPQAGAIKNLIKAIEKIHEFKIQLWLYTPHSKKFLSAYGIFESDKVILASGLPQQMKEIQKSADILFVPLSLKTKFPLLINTSSPGKTYEYLISGRPILMHAPPDSYIVWYAKRHGFALVVDKDDIEALKNAVMSLVRNKNLVKKLVDRAWRTAVLNHDAYKTAKLFKSFFK